MRFGQQREASGVFSLLRCRWASAQARRGDSRSDLTVGLAPRGRPPPMNQTAYGLRMWLCAVQLGQRDGRSGSKRAGQANPAGARLSSCFTATAALFGRVHGKRGQNYLFTGRKIVLTRMALPLGVIVLTATARTLSGGNGTADCETVPVRSPPEAILVRILRRPTMSHQ